MNWTISACAYVSHMELVLSSSEYNKIQYNIPEILFRFRCVFLFDSWDLDTLTTGSVGNFAPKELSLLLLYPPDWREQILKILNIIYLAHVPGGYNLLNCRIFLNVYDIKKVIIKLQSVNVKFDAKHKIPICSFFSLSHSIKL